MNEIATPPKAPQGVPKELLESPLFFLKRLGMAAKEQSFDQYEQAGLHPYHHSILAVLDEGSSETQGAIADALGYDKGQLVGLLDELEEAGLVERRRDPTDRRRQTVLITPAGRKTLEKLRALSKRLEEEFFGALDASERRELLTLLRKLGAEHLPNCRMLAPPK